MQIKCKLKTFNKIIYWIGLSINVYNIVGENLRVSIYGGLDNHFGYVRFSHNCNSRLHFRVFIFTELLIFVYYLSNHEGRNIITEYYFCIAQSHSAASIFSAAHSMRTKRDLAGGLLHLARKVKTIARENTLRRHLSRAPMILSVAHLSFSADFSYFEYFIPA